MWLCKKFLNSKKVSNQIFLLSLDLGSKTWRSYTINRNKIKVKLIWLYKISKYMARLIVRLKLSNIKKIHFAIKLFKLFYQVVLSNLVFLLPLNLYLCSTQ